MLEQNSAHDKSRTLSRVQDNQFDFLSHYRQWDSMLKRGQFKNVQNSIDALEKNDRGLFNYKIHASIFKLFLKAKSNLKTFPDSISLSLDTTSFILNDVLNLIEEINPIELSNMEYSDNQIYLIFYTLIKSLFHIASLNRLLNKPYRSLIINSLKFQSFAPKSTRWKLLFYQLKILRILSLFQDGYVNQAQQQGFLLLLQLQLWIQYIFKRNLKQSWIELSNRRRIKLTKIIRLMISLLFLLSHVDYHKEKIRGMLAGIKLIKQLASQYLSSHQIKFILEFQAKLQQSFNPVIDNQNQLVRVAMHFFGKVLKQEIIQKRQKKMVDIYNEIMEQKFNYTEHQKNHYFIAKSLPDPLALPNSTREIINICARDLTQPLYENNQNQLLSKYECVEGNDTQCSMSRFQQSLLKTQRSKYPVSKRTKIQIQNKRLLKEAYRIMTPLNSQRLNSKQTSVRPISNFKMRTQSKTQLLMTQSKISRFATQIKEQKKLTDIDIKLKTYVLKLQRSRERVNPFLIRSSFIKKETNKSIQQPAIKPILVQDEPRPKGKALWRQIILKNRAVFPLTIFRVKCKLMADSLKDQQTKQTQNCFGRSRRILDTYLKLNKFQKQTIEGLNKKKSKSSKLKVLSLRNVLPDLIKSIKTKKTLGMLIEQSLKGNSQEK